ncbi:AAC(3) family N-acetyltransferase [Roseospira navarrensis]|nr:AAC(3) family N-acetyltransferase [Roseospira navarrensis]
MQESTPTGGETGADDPVRALAARLRPLLRAPGTLYWVSVDFMTLLRETGWPPREADALADRLLHALLAEAGPDGTVLVSAFNFTFPRTGVFDARTTPVQTGAFGSMLLQRYPAQRTMNPFYSFLAFGARAPEVLANRFPHSTGPDSILEWVVDQDTRLIAIGHHYVKALSTVHQAETVAGVPYRYIKTFQGRLIGPEETREGAFTFLVRDLDTCDFSSVTLAGDAHMRAAGLVDVLAVPGRRGPLLVHGLSLAAAHDVMVRDLRSDQPRVVDYLGPNRPDPGVITSRVADRLYQEEARSLGTGSG